MPIFCTPWHQYASIRYIAKIGMSQIPCVSIVYSTVCSDADQRKHQSSASLAFVRDIHRWPVNSPHKGPVTRKMFPFDDVIMEPTDWELCCLPASPHVGIRDAWDRSYRTNLPKDLSYFFNPVCLAHSQLDLVDSCHLMKLRIDTFSCRLKLPKRFR